MIVSARADIYIPYQYSLLLNRLEMSSETASTGAAAQPGGTVVAGKQPV